MEFIEKKAKGHAPRLKAVKAKRHTAALDSVLAKSIASLKKEIAALREPPPPRPPADLSPQSGNSPDVTIKLPTQEDMARAREFLEDAWRRLVEMFGSVRKDIMRKT